MAKRPKKLTSEQETSIAAAIDADDAVALAKALADGVDPNAYLHSWGFTTRMLEQAMATQGEKRTVACLLEHGADPNVTWADDEGDRNITPLMEACEDDDLNLVELLLKHGADPTRVSKQGRSAINFIQVYSPKEFDKHLAMVRRLVEAGCPVVGPCLARPIEHGFPELVRYLIAHGADVNARSTKHECTSGGSGISMIYLAAAGRGGILCMPYFSDEERTVHLDILKQMIDAGANLNPPKAFWGSPLDAAASSNKIEAFRMLLDVGGAAHADPQSLGQTLKSVAARGDVEIARTLLELGADPTLPCVLGNTALKLATQSGNAEMIELIRVAVERASKSASCDMGLRPMQSDVESESILDSEGIAHGPEARVTDVPSDGSLGAAVFLKQIFNGHPEWAVLAVEAPIDEAAGAFVAFRKARSWEKNVVRKSLAEEEQFPMDDTPVVCLRDNRWTVFLRAVFQLESTHIADVPEEARALSQQLGVRTLTFFGEDTSSSMDYELYDRGERVEKASWETDTLERFSSTVRQHPVLSGGYFEIADQLIAQAGVFIPFCTAQGDEESSWVAIEPSALDRIERVDVITI